MARRRAYQLKCLNSKCGELYMGQFGQKYCPKCKSLSAVGNAKKHTDRLIFGETDRILHRNYFALKKNYDPQNPNKIFKLKSLQLDGLNTIFTTEFDKNTSEDLFVYWVYCYGYKKSNDGVITLKK